MYTLDLKYTSIRFFLASNLVFINISYAFCHMATQGFRVCVSNHLVLLKVNYGYYHPGPPCRGGSGGSNPPYLKKGGSLILRYSIIK